MHQSYHVDVGLAYMIIIHIKSQLFCSDRTYILRYKLSPYIHRQFSQNTSLMIGRTLLDFQCSEIFLHTFAMFRSHTTEIFINGADTGLNTLVNISNIKVWEDFSICQVLESVILYECHKTLDIVYRYTFNDTATHTVIWNSMYGSDIYVYITKKLILPNEQCDGYLKVVDVYYGTNTTWKAKLKDFNYTSAG
jgi:hypothetical protein